MVNPGTSNLALRLGTNGLIKQYYFTKIAVTKLVKCVKNWNMIGFVIFACFMYSSHIVSNLPAILWFALIFHYLEVGLYPIQGILIDGSWFDHQRLWILLMASIDKYAPISAYGTFLF